MAKKARLQMRMEQEPVAVVHKSAVGTYHPDPKAEVAWTVHDSRGTLDGGERCGECGACDCDVVVSGNEKTPACMLGGDLETDLGECKGLSFAFVCLDGGDVLCRECADVEPVAVVDCDCETTCEACGGSKTVRLPKKDGGVGVCDAAFHGTGVFFANTKGGL